MDSPVEKGLLRRFLAMTVANLLRSDDMYVVTVNTISYIISFDARSHVRMTFKSPTRQSTCRTDGRVKFKSFLNRRLKETARISTLAMDSYTCR